MFLVFDMPESRIIPFPKSPDTLTTKEYCHMDTPTELIHATIESLKTKLPLSVDASHVTDRLLSVDTHICETQQHAGALCFFDATRSEGGVKTFRLCVQDCTYRPQREGDSVLSPAEVMNLPTVRVSVRTSADGAQYSRWFHIVEKEGEYNELLGMLYSGDIFSDQE